MQLLTGFLFAAALVWSQSPDAANMPLPKPTNGVIQGFVREFGVDVPIGGVEIKLRKAGDRSGQKEQRTISDGSGQFSLSVTEPGIYLAEASAEGYMEPSPLERAPYKVSVGVGSTTNTLKLELYREAEVSGRVVDKTAVIPEAGILVKIFLVHFARGQVTLVPVGSATTTQEGEFRISALPPGSFLIELSSSVLEKISYGKEKDYTEHFVRPEGYNRVFWPDNTGSLRPATVTLNSGARLALGDLKIEKGPFYRIRGYFVSQEDCKAGDNILLNLVQTYGGLTITRDKATLPCNSPFTIHNLSPGSYEISAWAQAAKISGRAFSEAFVSINSEDSTLSMEMRVPRKIEGRLHLPDSVNESLANVQSINLHELRASVRPIGSLPFEDEMVSVPVATDGRFTLSVLNHNTYQFLLLGLKSANCIEKVVYNGVAIGGSIFSFMKEVDNQTLDIVVSDKAAELSGIVRRGDVKAPGVSVLIVPWPVEIVEKFPVFQTAITDEKGEFSTQGLRPGKYHLITVAQDVRQHLEEPDVLIGMLPSAEEIDLSDKRAAFVTLKIQ